MANESFITGELTETFKMGLIKIIPKKGDCGKLATGDLLHYCHADTSWLAV